MRELGCFPKYNIHSPGTFLIGTNNDILYSIMIIIRGYRFDPLV